MTELGKPIIVITGAAGNVGQALGRYLSHAYRVVGVDRVAPDGGPFPMYAADFANPASIGLAFEHIGREHGRSFASVVHLAAYYALSDEEHPLYESVNVAGTRSLLDVLQAFDVEQFIFGSTMLVHQACKPGERIDENSPIGPAWVYPRSKAAAELI